MSDPITYTVLAGDGQQYGPYPADNVQAWINEGRIQADQKMTRSDLKDWFRAGDFSEFAWSAAPAATVAAPAVAAAPAVMATAATRPSGKITLDQIDPVSLAGIRNAANWFFWIAGLSTVNFVLGLSGSGFSFALGSIAVDVCAALAHGIDGGQFNAVFAVVGALIIGLWILLGVFARRAHRSAFIIGMGLYLLDTLLLFMAFSFIAVIIHAWILYKIFDGLKDAWVLKKVMRG